MNKLPLFLLLFIFLSTSVSAQVDLIAPADDANSNNSTQSFEYYVGVENPVKCTLDIEDQTLPDTTVSQGMNTFKVQSLTQGSYDWQIRCENSTVQEQSNTRTLHLDFEAPTVELEEPQTASTLNLRVKATDDVSQSMSCIIQNNETTLDTITAQNATWYEEEYTVAPGDYELTANCSDEAGNEAEQKTNYTIEQQQFLTLTTNKQQYSLGEPIELTIDAPQGSEVTVDVCPNEEGFVECLSPLLEESFPQTVELPYNRSGEFIVEGMLQGPENILNSTNYTVDNTIGISLTFENKPFSGKKATLVAEVFNAFGDIEYVWELSNSSTITTTSNTIDVQVQNPGVYTETVTITDDAGNTKTESITYESERANNITLFVRDEANSSIAQATVQYEDQEDITNNQGRLILELEQGTTRVYAGKEGYSSEFKDFFVDENTTTIELQLKRQGSFNLTLDSPENDDAFTPEDQIAVKFTVDKVTNATCALYMGQEDFLEQKGTVQITEDGQHGFAVSELESGTYQFSISCEQAGREQNTETRTFTVTSNSGSATQTSVPDEDIIFFEDALESLKSLESDEQEFMKSMGFENELRQAKKRVGQLARDSYDMRYRNDLSEAEKEAERKRINEQIENYKKETVISAEVIDSRTIVEYITREEIRALLEEHSEAIDIPLAAADIINDAQQRYTMKTKVYRAEIKEADGESKEVSVVMKTLSYGKDKEQEGARSEYLIEVIPKKMARSADDLVILTQDYELLVDDPVLSFPAGPSIIYYVEKDVSLSDLEEARTVLIPEIKINDNGITGFSVFGSNTLSKAADSLGVSLAVLVAIIIASYLTYYFGLIGQLKYVLYQSGPKKQTHYMRVLLNDIHDQIQASNYDKAAMLYKEVRLSYDQLPVPAQNELIDEIQRICSEIDISYLKGLVMKMDKALKENRLEDAINYYERIEGTFHRLPDEEQQSVKTMVIGLGKRLGVAQ